MRKHAMVIEIASDSLNPGVFLAHRVIANSSIDREEIFAPAILMV